MCSDNVHDTTIFQHNCIEHTSQTFSKEKGRSLQSLKLPLIVNDSFFWKSTSQLNFHCKVLGDSRVFACAWCTAYLPSDSKMCSVTYGSYNSKPSSLLTLSLKVEPSVCYRKASIVCGRKKADIQSLCCSRLYGLYQEDCWKGCCSLRGCHKQTRCLCLGATSHKCSAADVHLILIAGL